MPTPPQAPPPPPPNAARSLPTHGAPVPRPIPGAFSRLLRSGASTKLLRPAEPEPRAKRAGIHDEGAEGAPAHPPVEARDGERHGGERDGEAPRDDSHTSSPEPLELLDPATRHLATFAPPTLTPAAPSQADAPATHARLSLEELMPRLVKRIAWAGDKHQGSVRLEIGAGAYSGTTVTVHADGGRVRVEVGGHGDLDGLRKRLDGRLRRYGLDVESVT